MLGVMEVVVGVSWGLFSFLWGGGVGVDGDGVGWLGAGNGEG